MSKRRVVSAGRNRRKPSRRSVLIRRLSGAALVCLVAGCGGVVYSNIFAANVYPTLGLSGYDEPVVRLPAKVATRNTDQAVNEAFAAFLEPVLSEKPETVASISPTMFNDRFGAAQPQGVASRAAEAAPAPQPPKLAEAPRLAEAPKSVSAPKVAEAPKPKEAAPVKVAMNVPPPAPPAPTPV